jgi:hypothetical protein
MSDYIRCEDLKAALQILSEEVLMAIINQRREFEDATRDYSREVKAALESSASQLNLLVDLNSRCFSQLHASSLVISVLAGITLFRGKISADAVFDIVASETDDPTALEFARSCLGARPRLRIIATSDGRALKSAGASDRARPSLSIVKSTPASPPE